MDILYTLNNGFVPQVASSITSICENNRQVKDITFYLLVIGVSTDNRDKLQHLIEHYHRHIKFISIDNLESNFPFKIDTGYWNPIVLARLLLHKILPKKVHRILYLDGDTIILGDLSDLYHANMGHLAVGACIESACPKFLKQSLGLTNTNYYNAGVLLIDVDKWRQEKIGEGIIKYYQAHNGKLFANDQDAINGYLKNQIYTLPPKYNYSITLDQYSYKFLKKIEQPAHYYSKSDYEEANKQPIIVHYAGENRPWRKYNTHKYRFEYKKYLNLTSWKNTPDEEGWHTYFIILTIFLTLTKPFNRLRYSLVGIATPKLMISRSQKTKKPRVAKSKKRKVSNVKN